MLRNMCGLMSGYSKKRELRKKRSVASVDQKVRLRKGGAMAVLGGRRIEALRKIGGNADRARNSMGSESDIGVWSIL
jgi:hypothetical protein